MLLLPVLLLAAPQVDKVVVGREHACALRGGEVWCWGQNENGQLGSEGLSTGRPQRVPGIVGAIDLAAGSANTCALMPDELRCWGWIFSPRNEATVLAVPGAERLFAQEGMVCVTGAWGARCVGGLPWIQGRDAKLHDFGVKAPVKQMSITNDHACALTKAGEIWCRGEVLGDMGGVQRWGLRKLPERAEAIAAGMRVLCLKQKGEWSCRDEDGPWKVGFGGKGALQLALESACALEGGKVGCFGRYMGAQMGPRRGDAELTFPVKAGATGLAFGVHSGCAVVEGGARCWGSNEHGQLGDGRPLYLSKPIPTKLPKLVRIRGGWHDSCGQDSEGKVFCWGGVFVPKVKPVYAFARAPMKDFSKTYSRICGVDAAGGVRCGYIDRRSMVGLDARWEDVELPPAPKARDVSNDRVGNVCIVDERAQIQCVFGRGESGGWTAGWAPIAGVKGAVQVAGAVNSMCARDEAGAVVCWRDHRFDGDEDYPSKAVQVPVTRIEGLPPIVQMKGGGRGHCGVSGTGALWCWNAKQGRGEPGYAEPRVQKMALSEVVEVQLDDRLYCARTRTGAIWCEGAGRFLPGPFGGRQKMARLKKMLEGPTIAVGVGHEHACATRPTGEVLCWGLDSGGQTGSGRVAVSAEPVEVRFPDGD